MLRDTAVRLIAFRLNNRTDIDDAIIQEMQLAQEMRLEQNGRFQPWFMTTEYATELTDPEEARVPVPDDFVIELEEEPLWVLADDGIWKRLTKLGEGDLQVKFGASDPAIPTHYALEGDHFTLFPTPDKVYQVRFRYAAKQEVLNANIENTWLKYASDILIAEVAETMALQVLQNEKLAAGFTKAKNEGWERLYVVSEARTHANRNYTMGE